MLQPAESHDLNHLADPVESAKTYLRQRGFHVFAAYILGGPRSNLIVVGTNPMEPTDVIEMAERIRARVA